MTEKMLAAVFHALNDLRVEEVPVPEIKSSTDVLLEVKTCGLCGTDPGIIDGRRPTATPPPFIIGHEYCGVVVDTGSEVESVSSGDHIVVCPTIPCGKCYHCRAGSPSLCPSYMDIGVDIGDGGFAEYSLVPENNAYTIPDSMGWKEAALIEPLSIILHGMRLTEMRTGDIVVVLGAGPMGLNWTAVTKRSGAGLVIVSEPNDKRRAIAGKIGADVLINPVDEDPVKVVRDLTNGIGANIVIEVAGHPDTYRQSIEMAASGGKIVFFAYPPPDFKIELNPHDIVRNEKHIIGNWLDIFTYPGAMTAMQNKILPTDILITHELKLTALPEAMELHKAGKSVKILINPK